MGSGEKKMPQRKTQTTQSRAFLYGISDTATAATETAPAAVLFY